MFCGFIAPVIFIASFFIQGIYKPGYSSLRHPVSSLSLGENGWVQVLTFLITGLLILCFTIQIQRALKDKVVSVLFLLVGIGLIASGIFSTDPLFGYPAEQPVLAKEFTVQGKLHSVSALLVFFGIPALCFRLRNFFKTGNRPKWKLYSVFTGTSMLILFFLATLALNDFPGLKQIAGLLQRFCIITGFVWISFLADHLNDKQALPKNNG